jgi:hypothetical protein
MSGNIDIARNPLDIRLLPKERSSDYIGTMKKYLPATRGRRKTEVLYGN